MEKFHMQFLGWIWVLFNLKFWISSDFQEVGVVRYGYVTYVGVTIILLFYYFVFIVLRGLVVEKTSMYDILQYPTRLHTTLSYN